ncbi:hypothetical protein MMC25_007005 [Agyrium rufum]|nr:hypothetical protein [Agyrium rufum]
MATDSSPAGSAPAASSGGKHEFLVLLVDKEGMLEKRMSVRPSHLEDIKPAVDAGHWTFGGAMLAEPFTPSADNQTPQIQGSVMLAQADTAEEVRVRLEQDIYAKEGIWDMEKVKIIPVRFVSSFL